MNKSSFIQTCQRALCLAIASTLGLAPLAHADNTRDMSRASVNASLALPGTLVFGTTQMLRDAGKVSVTAIRTVGQMTTLTLKAIGSGVEVSVQVSAKVLQGIAIGVGTALEAVVVATGVMICAAGAALIFIPNEVGSNLLHHSRASK